MGSCSAINTMYGGKKSRKVKRSRRYKRMRGGYTDENGNIIEESVSAVSGSALGAAEVVKENVGEIVSEGSTMLSKLGAIFANAGEKIKEAIVGKTEQESSTLSEKISQAFSNTGEKLKEASESLYGTVVGESTPSQDSGIIFGGRRRRHKSSKHKMSGGRKSRKNKRRQRSSRSKRRSNRRN